MPENNIQQAELPEGCTVFDNPGGTAPGGAFEAGGVHVLMLPGPPHECETMLRRCVEPYLRALSREVIVSRDIMTFGMGESSVDQLLHDRMAQMCIRDRCPPGPHRDPRRGRRPSSQR